MEISPILPTYESFLRDESRLQGTAEEICFPETPEETAEAFIYAREKHMEVTIQGSRTGLSGGAVPAGGLIVNLSRLTFLGSVQAQPDETALISAGAGVTLGDLQKKTVPWVFPLNPSEKTASLGGLFSTNAAGPWKLSRGPASSWVEKLTWVTPGGEIWKITRGENLNRGRTMILPDGTCLPCAEQMDLIDFLAGSEGKLGAAAELTWRLLPPNGELWGLVFFFESQDQLSKFEKGLRRLTFGTVTLLSAEFFSSGALKLLRNHRNHPLLRKFGELPGETAVYLELEGNPDHTVDALSALLDLFENCGGEEENSWAENSPAGVENLRNLRHGLTTILGELPEICNEEGIRWEADFEGPEEQFLPYAAACEALFKKHSVPGAVYGHMLSNGLHAVLLPETEKERQACDGLLWEIGEFAAQNRGHLCREYGIGTIGFSRFHELLRDDLFEKNQKHRFMDPKNLLGFPGRKNH